MRQMFLVLFVLLLSSCASKTPPSVSLIDTVPVVQVGEAGTAPAEHIVYIPANTEFPIHFAMKGTIFNEEISSTVMATLKQDMYLYKYWASLDGKKWINSHELMSVKPSGGFDANGGKVEVELNLTN